MVQDKDRFPLRENDDGLWYIARVPAEEYEKHDKKNDLVKFWDRKTRIPREKCCSDLYESRQAAVKELNKRHFENYVHDPKNQQWHIDYTRRNSYDRRLHVCHDCKIIMFHTMSWCFSCGKKAPNTKFSAEETIKMYESEYKIGW